MGIMKLENVREFVEKHTDEQCGLDVANVEVWDNFDSIRITVNHKNKKQQGKMYKKSGSTGMKQEWREQAEDLIDEIGKDPRAGYGGLGIVFVLESVYDSGFHLLEDNRDLMKNI